MKWILTENIQYLIVYFDEIEMLFTLKTQTYHVAPFAESFSNIL